MYRRSVNLICILSVLIMSCEDTFTTTLEVDPPDFQDLLVVHLLFDNMDERISARIGRTIPVLEEVSREESLVDDASIEIYENGLPFATLIRQDDMRPEFNYSASSAPELREGQTYEMRVDHPTYGLHLSRQVMPKKAEVRSIVMNRDAGKNIDGSDVSSIEVIFNDEPGIENFYRMSIAIWDTVSQTGSPVYLEFEDPIMQYSFEGSLVASDEGFDGKRYTFKLLMYRSQFDQVKQKGFLVWESLTRDLYRYTTSLYRYLDGEDFAGFSEPTIVTSNIEGGIGCFGLSNSELIALPR